MKFAIGILFSIQPFVHRLQLESGYKYRHSSQFAILAIRDFADSPSNFSIPLLVIRDDFFANSRL